MVSDVSEIGVRTGDRRMSELPDGLQALNLTTERQPAVFYDFDGTLSEIVEDPDAARLVDGAADALTSLSAACPVAILSGRDLADVRERIGLPGLWYAGSHGFELTGPDGAHHENPEAAASIPVLAEAAAALGRPARPHSGCGRGAQAIRCRRALPQRRPRPRRRGGRGGAKRRAANCPSRHDGP